MVSFVLFPLRCWCAFRAVAAVQVRGLVFLSLGWVRKTVANPPKVGRRWQDWTGDDACLLASLCVIALLWVQVGWKRRLCLRNGKGLKLCWAECVRHDEHSFTHSFTHSFPLTQSPESPFNRPLTSRAGTFVRRQAAGAVDGAV